MSAIGNFISPMFIFPRKIMRESLMNGTPTQSIGDVSDSGWTDGRQWVDGWETVGGRMGDSGWTDGRQWVDGWETVGGRMGDCGWTDGRLFLKWLQHFVNKTNCTKDSRHLIILKYLIFFISPICKSYNWSLKYIKWFD